MTEKLETIWNRCMYKSQGSVATH